MNKSVIQLRTLVQREILRYVRRPWNTFLPPFITNVLYFSVFGVILGSRIGETLGYSYIQFVFPGLIVLGAISNAFENASFSIFHGRWNEYIEAVLTSPISYRSTVAAYVLSSSLRGFLIGILIFIVGLIFTTVPLAHPLYFLAFMLIITTLFAGFGVIGGLWAKDFDYLTVLNQFILRPLVFFGGVFYSLEILPNTWRTISLLNPMVYMVNGIRYGMLGIAEVDPNFSLAILTVGTISVLGIDLLLFKRGYGLVD